MVISTYANFSSPLINTKVDWLRIYRHESTAKRTDHLLARARQRCHRRRSVDTISEIHDTIGEKWFKRLKKFPSISFRRVYDNFDAPVTSDRLRQKVRSPQSKWQTFLL
jgi:hypothetical protein